MDYIVTEEMGHARGDIVGNFFGHVMCGVESFALNPFGPLTPEAKRVKASFYYSAFRPERQDGHVEFFCPGLRHHVRCRCQRQHGSLRSLHE